LQITAYHRSLARMAPRAPCTGNDSHCASRTDYQGAAFTFDLESYAAFIRALRVPLLPTPPAPIPFPTFDHSAKDPAPSPVPILPRHRIVIIEGLYTMLSEPGWSDCAAMMDMRVWVEVPREVVLQRVLKRNTDAGIVTDLKTARIRVEQSDMVNGDEVFAHRYEPTDTIYPADIRANGEHGGVNGELGCTLNSNM